MSKRMQVFTFASLLFVWLMLWIGVLGYAQEQCQENPQVARLIGPVLAPKTGCVEDCTGYIFCQNFEQTVEPCDPCTEDRSESWNPSDGTGGSTNMDDTTAPILRGTQHFRAFAGNAGQYSGAMSTTVGDKKILYVHFLFRVDDATPSVGTYIINFLDSGQNIKGYVSLNTTGVLYCNAGGSSNSTIAAMSSNTTYHVWAVYMAEDPDGALNGFCSVGFSTTTTEPTSGDYYTSKSNCTSSDAIRYIRLMVQNQLTQDYDQVYVDDAPLGEICE